MHAVRIDEILLRRSGSGLVRVIAPVTPGREENVLGRPFGFVSVAVPRTPQLDALVSEMESVIENAYGHGSLKVGQTPEQFFEDTVTKVRETFASAMLKERIKIDPSLLTIGLACVVGEQVFLTRHGRAEAYLIRREEGQSTKTMDIFRGFEDDSDERILNDLVVGKVSENDLLLFANAALFEIAPVADIISATDKSEAASVAARIRSMVLAVPSGDAVAGCLMRIAPVRALFRAKENASVNSLRSREEEVARTLSPSGMPAVGAFLDRFKPKAKPEAAPAAKAAKPAGPQKSPIERFNGLPPAAKKALLVLLVLAAIFAVSLKINSMKNAREAADEKFNADIETIVKQINLAESTVIYDEARARAILTGAQNKEKELLASNKKQEAQKSELEKALSAADRKLQRLYDVDPKILETLKANASFVAKTSGGLLMNAGTDLLLVDANGSPTEIATLPAAPVWAAVATDADNAVYLWLENDTLVSLPPGNKQIPRSLDYAGPEKPKAGAIWGGRLYVLSADGSQIWKLPSTLTGFGRGTTWLSSPLSKAVGLSIDGSIWTAVSNDAVRRFSKGKMDAFAASGSPANAEPISLQVTANGSYLLGANNMLAVWDKNGKLLAQYVIPAADGKVTAFAVDEAARQIIIATDKALVATFGMVK